MTKPTPPAHGKSSGGVPRSKIPLDVYNGTLIGGLSAGTGADLTQLGFPVTAGLTWSSQDITQTLIEYPPGHQAAAKVVQAVMPGATLRQVSGLATDQDRARYQRQRGDRDVSDNRDGLRVQPGEDRRPVRLQVGNAAATDST